jgi:hypothetical protein
MPSMTSYSPVSRPARMSMPKVWTVSAIALYAGNRPRWPVERGEEAISGGVDLVTAKAAKHGADGGVVALHMVAPASVAERRRLLRGADDVGEQDGGEHSIKLRVLAANACKQVVDGPHHAVLIADPTVTCLSPVSSQGVSGDHMELAVV